MITNVPLPTGVQPLPEWLKGLHVDFMMDYGNSPVVKLKVKGDVYEWPGKAWAKEDARHYRARSDDGRMTQLHHDGAVRPDVVWRTYAANGKPVEYRWMLPTVGPDETAEGAARREADEKRERMAQPTPWPFSEHVGPFRSVLKALDVTVEDHGGFGGGQYLLPMTDGSERLLRGPWSGGTPAGFVDVSTWDTDDQLRYPSNRPWHHRGGRAGLFVTEELFLRAVARFAPHLCVARVDRWGLELYRPEWGTTKRLWQESQS